MFKQQKLNRIEQRKTNELNQLKKQRTKLRKKVKNDKKLDKDLKKLNKRINKKAELVNEYREINRNSDTTHIITMEWDRGDGVDNDDAEELRYKIDDGDWIDGDNFDGNMLNNNLFVMRYIFRELNMNDTGRVNVVIGNRTIEHNIVGSVNTWYNRPFDGLEKYRAGSDNSIFYLYPERITLMITPLVNIQPRRLRQFYLDGENIHCFFEPIREFYHNKSIKDHISSRTKKNFKSKVKKINKLIKKYNTGISEDDIKNECNSLNVSIKFYNFFDIKNPYFEYNSNTSHYLFQYINTRSNHLEIFNKIEKEIVTDYDVMTQLLEDNKECIYKKSRHGINNIKTKDKEYIFNSELTEEIRLFEEETLIDRFKINYNENPDISNYIFNGVRLTGYTSFIEKYKGDYKHIDQKRAYLQFKKTPYYGGFPTIFNNFHKFSKNDFDIRTFLDRNIGYYQIENINYKKMDRNTKRILKKLDYIERYEIYASTELLFLYDNGLRFNLTSGLWCDNRIHFRDEDLEIINRKINLNGEETGIYAVWTGMMCSIQEYTKYYMKIDEKFSRNVRSYTDNVNYNAETGEAIIKIKKQNIIHKSHIAGFIFAYQRINLFTQLFKFKKENIIRICMDGIFYKGETPEIDETFREKKGILTDINCFHFINKISVANDQDDWDFLTEYNPEHNYRTVALLGAGGTGKTHNALEYNKHNNILFIAPSYKLTRAKGKEYDYIKLEDVMANVLLGKKWSLKHKDYNIVIIDEITMITEEQKQSIIEKFPYSKIYFCGDIERIKYKEKVNNILTGYVDELNINDIIFGYLKEKDKRDKFVSYQLPPPNQYKVMNLEGIGNEITFTKNYRFTCNKLKELAIRLRQDIKSNKNYLEVLHEFKKFMKKEKRIINKDKLLEIYDIKDTILSARNKCHKCKKINCKCNVNHTYKFNELLKDRGVKIMVKTNTQIYSNGDILINPEKLPRTKKIEYRHSFTIHSYQGETIKDNKLFIYEDNFFDITMLYTAISRVKRLDQIYLIEKF